MAEATSVERDLIHLRAIENRPFEFLLDECEILRSIEERTLQDDAPKREILEALRKHKASQLKILDRKIAESGGK